MNFIERYNKLKSLSWHIDKKATGTAEQMASKLGIGRTTLYTQYLNVLKDLGAEIEYDFGRKSYYYGNDFKFPC